MKKILVSLTFTAAFVLISIPSASFAGPSDIFVTATKKVSSVTTSTPAQVDDSRIQYAYDASGPFTSCELNIGTDGYPYQHLTVNPAYRPKVTQWYWFAIQKAFDNSSSLSIFPSNDPVASVDSFAASLSGSYTGSNNSIGCPRYNIQPKPVIKNVSVTPPLSCGANSTVSWSPADNWSPVLGGPVVSPSGYIIFRSVNGGKYTSYKTVDSTKTSFTFASPKTGSQSFRVQRASPFKFNPWGKTEEDLSSPALLLPSSACFNTVKKQQTQNTLIEKIAKTAQTNGTQSPVVSTSTPVTSTTTPIVITTSTPIISSSTLSKSTKVYEVIGTTSTAVSKITAAPIPSTPTKLSVTSTVCTTAKVSTSTANISWPKDPSATWYNIDQSFDGINYTAYLHGFGATTTQTVLTPATGSSYYEVTAINTDNVKSAPSAPIMLLPAAICAVSSTTKTSSVAATSSTSTSKLKMF